MTTCTERHLQDAGRRLAGEHVYNCLSSLFYALVHEEWKETIGDYETSEFYRTDDFEDDPESEHAEVYEQWNVSSWLAHQLKDEGETVREFFGMQVWLRTCTGQALYMDTCFRQIVRRLGRAEP